MRRVVLAVGVCCLVLLAGCGGGPGGTVTQSPTGTATDAGGGTDAGDGTDGGSDDGTDTTTASPTATPTATAAPGGGGGSATPTATPTRTPTPSAPTGEQSFPPGTNASGVTNRAALFGAHQSTLGETDYAVNLTQVIVGDESRTRTVSVVRSDLDGGRLAGTFLADNVSVDTFRNESRLYRRQTVDDRTSYRVRNTTGTFRSYHDRRTSLVESSASVYRFANYTANGTVERDGRTLTRFDLDAVNGSAVAENVTVTGAEGTLLIDDRGLIVRSTLELRGESDGGDDRRLFVDYRVTEAGEVTVDRPDWLATAAQESG